MGLMQQEDWYAYLKLAADSPAEQIEQAVERLSRQAAALAVTAPERSQRLRDTVRAIKRDLLSGPESRRRYDAARATVPVAPAAASAAATSPAAAFPAAAFPAASAGAPQADVPPAVPVPSPPPVVEGPPPVVAGAPPVVAGALPGEGIGSRIARFLRTGWTCAACGKEALPSDKFCTRCGAPIAPTRRDPGTGRARTACVNCEAPLGANDVFCAKCGTRAEFNDNGE